MPIKIELAGGKIITVDRQSATIGRGPESDILIPDSLTIQPEHAKISKVANRWLIESAGDWLLQVGGGVPGRKLWLKPGDVVHLTESGPDIVFAPNPKTPKIDVQTTETHKAPQPIAPMKEGPEPASIFSDLKGIEDVDDVDLIWEDIYDHSAEDEPDIIVRPADSTPAHAPKQPPAGQRLSDPELGTELIINGAPLFYKAPVTETEANRLGKYLVENNEFNGEPQPAQIRKSGITYRYRIVSKKGRELDPEFIKEIKALASRLSRRVFNSAEVEIHLCDVNFHTIRVVVPYGKS